MCNQLKHLSDIPQCKMRAYVFARETSRCWEPASGRPLPWPDTGKLPQSRSHFPTTAEWLPGVSVVISCLNNMPMSCFNAKKTSCGTTSVSYLFPFGASQQKQNNIIRTYVECLKASNSSVISGCEVKAYRPLPFMKKGFECSPPVLTSVAQSPPCLPFLSVFKELISTHNCVHVFYGGSVFF